MSEKCHLGFSAATSPSNWHVCSCLQPAAAVPPIVQTSMPMTTQPQAIRYYQTHEGMVVQQIVQTPTPQPQNPSVRSILSGDSLYTAASHWNVLYFFYECVGFVGCSCCIWRVSSSRHIVKINGKQWGCLTSQKTF